MVAFLAGDHKMIELHDVENSGECPGSLADLKAALEWEVSLKKALMESQERLVKRVKALELALEGILEHFKDNSTCPTCIITLRILRNYD